MSSVAARPLIAQRSPASRCRQLLLGPPLARLATGHLDPVPAAGTAPLPPATATVGVLLVLHAFAAGCTALTGVEAISNGVPAFRPPEARNARRTLVALGAILGSLFIGVSSLAILVLAANASFVDFPRLVSFAAADAFLPRWFTKRGQRLVYSNGVLGLAAAAAAVTLAFRAGYNRMLPLYAIGVFTSFTFSQAGMTRRRLRLREPGWRHGIAVNGTGALVTFLVLLPRHGDQGGFRRLLHDQTGRNLFGALNRLKGVNVAIVHLPAPHPVVP
jgi:amino acid transporter